MNDIIITYLKLGIEKDNLTDIRKYDYGNDYSNYKSVYLPEEYYNFIGNKSKCSKVGTTIIFMNYLVSGIKEEKGFLSKELSQWFDNLKIIG